MPRPMPIPAPWAFKYQSRERGAETWIDGERSAHSGTCLEMYKSDTWLGMYPDLEHRIIAADGSIVWHHEPQPRKIPLQGGRA